MSESPQVRVSSRDVVSGELTIEFPGDFTVVTVQQRGDNTYVVVKPDPTGESYQREQREKLEAGPNAGTAPVPGDAPDDVPPPSEGGALDPAPVVEEPAPPVEQPTEQPVVEEAPDGEEGPQ